MMNYNIDVEGWLGIEADNEDDAFAKAQSFIAELEELVNNYFTLTSPFEVVVADNGVTEEEE